MKTTLTRLLLTTFSLILATTGYTQTVHRHKKQNSLSSRQLMVLLTSGWDTVPGKLYAFQKHGDKWILKFSNAVVVGSKGLAAGDGLVKLAIKSAPIKHEGDKRSPAGIFSIGTAFGYAEKKDAWWIKDPYIRAFDTLICVDDMRSPDYNKLTDKDSIKNKPASFEYMHRKDDFYKWGLFINHNADKTVPGDGSCIFMHIWENDHTGTDGCTAMPEQYMLRILRWINAEDHPLLVQLPADTYAKFRRRYNLPKINGD